MSRLLSSVVCAVVLLLSACVGGNRVVDTSFTVNIPNLKVHVINSPACMPAGVGNYNRMALGLARWSATANEIWLYGWQDDAGNVFISEFIAGHELLHILRAQWPKVVVRDWLF